MNKYQSAEAPAYMCSNQILIEFGLKHRKIFTVNTYLNG